MEGGVWRTISGRRVFIKDGQSLSDAMKESGKFKEDGDSKSAPSQKTKSGNYTFEHVNETNPEFEYDNKAFVVKNEAGEVVYKKYYHDSGNAAEIVKKNFEMNEEYAIKYFQKEAKKLAKLQKSEEFGNYRSTKYGSEMYKRGETIQQATGDAVKKIRIDKSEVSDSRYINLQMDTEKYPSMRDTYTIRVSDHVRPSYSANGAFGGYDHYYDYEVITDSFTSVNWDIIVTDVIRDINSLK